MNWISKEKAIVVLISLGLVILVAAVMYFQPPFINHWIVNLESGTYDRQVRRYHRPVDPNSSVIIVDIDDKSISEEGRWPWNRDKLAQLAVELNRLGASVIAFDMVFSEPEENPVDAVVRAVGDGAVARELESFKSQFDNDAIFADALKKGTCALGFAFASNGKETGMLPRPILTLSKKELSETLIPEMNGYIGNLPQLQQAAKQGGFINTMIDADGILRFSPLLLHDKESVYPSLALESAQMFLATPFSGILATMSGNNQVIRGIKLGKLTIPTDPWGRILIPYRGLPFSFPYISATDVLHGKATAEQVRGKLVFVGMSATASSDLLTTPISPAFPGVEVQATIASGIIDGYLPHKPDWGRGLSIAVVLVLGGIAALIFPFISRTAAFLFSLTIIGVVEGVNYWMWTRFGIVLSFFFPMPTLVTIFLLDVIGMYISDSQQKKEIKKIFGQYVPTDLLERMIRKKGTWTLTGERKELTILFANVRNFASISQSFSAAEMKNFLTSYFNQMSEIVFAEKGILDKYVRDQISAFWGAPFPEPKKAALAIKTALAMTKANPQVGIGISTGDANVGDMGSKFARSYTAIGYPVDLAHHLMKLTAKYSVSILVSEETWKETQTQFVFRKVDTIEFEGKPLDIYEPKQ